MSLSSILAQGTAGVNRAGLVRILFSLYASSNRIDAGYASLNRHPAGCGVLLFLGVHVITIEQVDLLTVTQAARELGATRSLVHYHRLYGRLPAIVVDRKYLIPREAVEALRGELLARHGQKDALSR